MKGRSMGYGHLALGCATAHDFAGRLVSEVAPDEWRRLEEGCIEGEISAFNRAVLLRLRDSDYRAAPGEPFDADGASRMADMLQSFLDQHLSGNLRAQRWVALSCLALAFVFREPLHPIEVVKAQVRMVDGKATYYCPACEGSGTLCGYCVCHPIG